MNAETKVEKDFFSKEKIKITNFELKINTESICCKCKKIKEKVYASQCYRYICNSCLISWLEKVKMAGSYNNRNLPCFCGQPCKLSISRNKLESLTKNKFVDKAIEVSFYQIQLFL